MPGLDLPGAHSLSVGERFVCLSRCRVQRSVVLGAVAGWLESDGRVWALASVPLAGDLGGVVVAGSGVAGGVASCAIPGLEDFSRDGCLLILAAVVCALLAVAVGLSAR